MECPLKIKLSLPYSLFIVLCYVLMRSHWWVYRWPAFERVKFWTSFLVTYFCNLKDRRAFLLVPFFEARGLFQKAKWQLKKPNCRWVMEIPLMRLWVVLQSCSSLSVLTKRIWFSDDSKALLAAGGLWRITKVIDLWFCFLSARVLMRRNRF